MYIFFNFCVHSLGMIDAGIGESQINTVLSSLNVPAVTAPLLKRHERIVGTAIEAVAQESCLESIRLENEITLNKMQK